MFAELIAVKPLTTEATSVLDPRPASGPYVPYDFSNLTFLDVIALTLRTGGQYMLIGCLFFFFVQWASHYILSALFKEAYTKRRTPKQQREDCVRVCAIVNGLTSVPAAFLFFRSFIKHGFQLHSYHYQPFDYYDFNRGFITGYFIWDIIVCVLDRWGFLWTTHGIFSFLGSFLLNFPVSDHIGCYFSGTFELTNGLMHSSALLRTYNVRLDVATIFEYLFALFYLLIRVIGGSYCSYTWISDMLVLWGRGEVHSYPAVAFLIFSLSTVMLLQYVWFWEIVQIGLGLKKSSIAAEIKPVVLDNHKQTESIAPPQTSSQGPSASNERSSSTTTRKRRAVKEN